MKKRKAPKRRSTSAKALASPKYKQRKVASKKVYKRKEKWLGWYFAETSERLRYKDGRKIAVGETHTVNCAPIMCQQGLHASPTVLDALKYAPGNILYRVSLSGTIIHDTNKSVATKRTYLARIEVEPILREFARKCALQVIHLWNCPHIVREYLGNGDESKKAAAWDAAWAATMAAATATTRDAARAAAWAAATATTRNAAMAAAWDAAMAAAWNARDIAWDAAWDAARAAAWDARDVAWDAAWAAARAAQKKMLDEMVLAALALTKSKPRRKSP